MRFEVPTLETPRLILRGWREQDLDAFAAMAADPEIARFATFDGQPQSRDEAWRTIAIMAGQWILRGYSMFAIEDKQSGEFVGRAGLWAPDGWHGYELGWAVARAFQGRGYATEAVRAAIAWGFDRFPIDALDSLIALDNPASEAVARKLGQSPRADTIHAGRPHRIWTLNREQWERRAPDRA